MNKAADSATKSVILGSDSVHHPAELDSEASSTRLFQFTLLPSESEMESEVDEVVQDFLNHSELQEHCFHEVKKSEDALATPSLQTSEAEFSDCGDV